MWWRGLYAYDAEDARAEGKKARAELDAKKALRKERKAYQKAGKSLPKDFEAKGAYRDAMAKVDSLEEDIARADHGSARLPFGRLLNYKVEDAAEALRLGEDIDKLPDFLKEMPVIDVAAAGTCGLLEAKTDHDEGWSWTHSITLDGAANVGGLVVGGAATAGLIALAPFEVPTAVAAGVGAVVVVGATGIIDHSLHEHWSEDIHDHGVVGGLLDGSGHVLSQTGGITYAWQTTSGMRERSCGMASQVSSEHTAAIPNCPASARVGTGTAAGTGHGGCSGPLACRCSWPSSDMSRSSCTANV